jgi:hypothetical protein
MRDHARDAAAPGDVVGVVAAGAVPGASAGLLCACRPREPGFAHRGPKPRRSPSHTSESLAQRKRFALVERAVVLSETRFHDTQGASC